MFYLSRFYQYFINDNILPSMNMKENSEDWYGISRTRWLKWLSKFTSFNIIFKVGSVKKRSRGEPSLITNKMSHMINGNRQTPGDHISIVFTNVLGNCSVQNIEISVKLILNRFKPGILGLAEPSYEVLKLMHFPGYRLIKGKLNGGKKVRLNVLVKDTLLNVKVETFTTEVPSLLLSAGGFKYLMFYRQWRKDGADGTDNIQLQEARWETFIRRVKRIGGKLIVMGDANVDYLSEDTAHQKNLTNIREEMFGLLAEKGYAQLIKEDTRHRGEQKGCLDHIYTGQVKHVAEVFNENVHGWDHNLIGER